MLPHPHPSRTGTLGIIIKQLAAQFTLCRTNPATAATKMKLSQCMTNARHPGAFKAARACPIVTRKRVVVRAAEIPDAVKQQMQQAMQDPAMAEKMKQMQEAMSKPEVQQQMQEMQAYMQNQQVQQRMQALREDPEFKQMFEEIQSGGMGALMKYMNDPKVLAKIGERLGDVQVQVPPQGAAAAAAAAASAGRPPAADVPEIDNLIDAAKYGDLEAVEDFIAIGKDVNAGDAEQRTPLHYACGFNHLQIAKMLIGEGAKLENTDSKGNTPLHYAAGYGRPQLVELLLASGANGAAKNSNGNTPMDLATTDERNPLNQTPEVMEKLRAAASA